MAQSITTSGMSQPDSETKHFTFSRTSSDVSLSADGTPSILRNIISYRIVPVLHCHPPIYLSTSDIP